jgi:hypothetical protein
VRARALGRRVRDCERPVFVAVVLLVRTVEGLQERFLLMVVVLSVWAFGRSLMLW